MKMGYTSRYSQDLKEARIFHSTATGKMYWPTPMICQTWIGSTSYNTLV